MDDDIWFAFNADDFKLYCCPACDFRIRSEDEFKRHAIVIHGVPRDVPWMWTNEEYTGDFQSGQELSLETTSSDEKSDKDNNECELETNLTTYDNSNISCELQSEQDVIVSNEVTSKQDLAQEIADCDSDTTLESDSCNDKLPNAYLHENLSRRSVTHQIRSSKRKYDDESYSDTTLDTLDITSQEYCKSPPSFIDNSQTNTASFIASSVNDRYFPLKLDEAVSESETF